MTSKVISMADYLTGKDRSKRISGAKVPHPSHGFEGTNGYRDDSRRSLATSPAIIPFPEPRHPLPAA